MKTVPALPSRKEFIGGLIVAVGKVLADKMGVGYRSCVGEAIFALVTVRPHIVYYVMRLWQRNVRPHRLQFVGLCHLLCYLCDTRTDGIYILES